jgi:hypothetical protein
MGWVQIVPVVHLKKRTEKVSNCRPWIYGLLPVLQRKVPGAFDLFRWSGWTSGGLYSESSCGIEDSRSRKIFLEISRAKHQYTSVIMCDSDKITKAFPTEITYIVSGFEKDIAAGHVMIESNGAKLFVIFCNDL